MTKQKYHIIIATVVVVLTIITGVVAFIFFPPAGAGVVTIGGALAAWCIAKALDKVVDSIGARDAANESSREASGDTIHTRTTTIHRHYSENNEDGAHVSEDVNETIVESDAKPKRPKP